MIKIVLPENILEKDKYQVLPALQKGEYVHNFLKQIIKLNSGVTVSQIDKSTYLGRSTIWHHLEILASRADCLKVERGDTDVYHSNKVLASLEELDIKDNYYYYTFHLVENILGKFVRIQIKQEGRAGNHVCHSGVLINYNLLGNIVSSLSKIEEKPSE